MKNGFTVIELIFIIVILGILSAVALPHLTGKSNSSYTQVNNQQNTYGISK